MLSSPVNGDPSLLTVARRRRDVVTSAGLKSRTLVTFAKVFSNTTSRCNIIYLLYESQQRNCIRSRHAFRLTSQPTNSARFPATIPKNDPSPAGISMLPMDQGRYRGTQITVAASMHLTKRGYNEALTLATVRGTVAPLSSYNRVG
jgi:hypothetical protein